MAVRLTRRDLAASLAAASAVGSARAQTTPSAWTQLQNEGRYLPLWRAQQADPKAFNGSQTSAFVGEETIALAQTGPTGNDLVSLPDEATARDAIEVIVEASRGRRVVMLNESHSASRHRQFLAQVLRALRPEGFSILAAEDFLNSRDLGAPNIRTLKPGGVLDPRCGYYQCDPAFGEAVREAVDLGYRLACYEQRSDQRIQSDDRVALIANRENHQADNFIADVLTPNPDARVLVYCGFSHLRKTPDHGGNIWFARRLLEKSGVEALCVSQAFTGAFGPHGTDRPLTKAVLARFAPFKSIVVRGADGVVAAAEAGADLAIFHPARPDVAGRPGWLAADPIRQRLEVATPKRPTDEIVIVQAVHAGDPDFAIPADQQVLKAGETLATLFLRPGAYRLRLETDVGFTPLRTVTV